jgi:hypothetical protein
MPTLRSCVAAPGKRMIQENFGGRGYKTHRSYLWYGLCFSPLDLLLHPAVFSHKGQLPMYHTIEFTRDVPVDVKFPRNTGWSGC